jgi:DNA-directed RNA polymerase specialized sigma24 family protein
VQPALDIRAASFVYRAALSSAPFSSATLAELYRFVLLLTGDLDVAQEIMAGTLRDAAARLEEMRGDDRRCASFIARLRERCLRENAANPRDIPRLVRTGEEPREVLAIEAYIVAQRFSTLPEPERSALALFYLDLLDVPQIAALLGFSLEELAATLGRARTHLHAALHPAG